MQPQRLVDTVLSKMPDPAASSGLLMGTIVSIDYTAYTAMVAIGGNAESSGPFVFLQSCPMTVGRSCWLAPLGNNAYLIVGAEDVWHTVGNAGEPAYQNSWAGRSGGITRFKHVGDHVSLQGSIAGGTNGTTIFTLPVGYRPSVQAIVAHGRVNDGGTEFLTYMFITTAGAVSQNTAGTVGAIDAVDFTIQFPVS
jgi:hypothetical protein